MKRGVRTFQLCCRACACSELGCVNVTPTWQTVRGYWHSHHHLLQPQLAMLHPCQWCEAEPGQSRACGSPGSAGLAEPLSLSPSAGSGTVTVCLRCINLLLGGAAVSSSSTNPPLQSVAVTWPALCSSSPTDFNLLLSKLLIAICKERDMSKALSIFFIKKEKNYIVPWILLSHEFHDTENTAKI